MPLKQPVLTKKQKKAQVASLVNVAMKTTSLPTSMKNWMTYSRHNLDLKIEYKFSKDVSPDEMNDIFCLLKTNMFELYEQSEWGWEDEKKKSELEHADARFLIVKDPAERIVAFCHLRFDVELNLPLLYCYEVQIVQELQRKGLGRHLMGFLNVIAYQFKLVKVLLTVFTFHKGALDFYMNALKFRKDESSPYDEEDKSYIILCKFVDKFEIDKCMSFLKL